VPGVLFTSVGVDEPVSDEPVSDEPVSDEPVSGDIPSYNPILFKVKIPPRITKAAIKICIFFFSAKNFEKFSNIS